MRHQIVARLQAPMRFREMREKPPLMNRGAVRQVRAAVILCVLMGALIGAMILLLGAQN